MKLLGEDNVNFRKRITWSDLFKRRELLRVPKEEADSLFSLCRAELSEEMPETAVESTSDAAHASL